MYHAPLPLPILIFAIVAFICYLFKTGRRQQSDSNLYDSVMSANSDPLTERERKNISDVEKLVARYDGYTAEVFDINVFGRRKVETFRLLNPGEEVTLRKYRNTNGIYKVFAFDEYVADIIVTGSSRLPQLFQQKIPFYAYLGGRDRAFRFRDDYDSCSIIVFYKMDGVPPTKVNLS